MLQRTWLTPLIQTHGKMDKEEVYRMANVLATCGGLKVMLDRKKKRNELRKDKIQQVQVLKTFMETSEFSSFLKQVHVYTLVTDLQYQPASTDILNIGPTQSDKLARCYYVQEW
ncbi:uncharacterized protein LOC128552035 [Mercenaria mercenaria]|uniref:uncharacterized protein LOC128552035 n=1 Tax=Mercenaria mercenaria TaxID=6596 RepID=UPI00234FAEBC|nr:uncharacterized protein LOC128552035 [Mercenaria mercenaria]